MVAESRKETANRMSRYQEVEHSGGSNLRTLLVPQAAAAAAVAASNVIFCCV